MSGTGPPRRRLAGPVGHPGAHSPDAMARVPLPCQNRGSPWPDVATKSYDWLLQYLLGPFFRVQLSYIDDRERHRVGRAEITGDV